MTTRIKVLIAILCMLILAFARYSSYKDGAADVVLAQEKARIETRYQKDIEGLKNKIAEKQAELAGSEKRAGALRGQLSVAKEKMQDIAKPQTLAEAKKRLQAAGYEVVENKDVCTGTCLSDESAKKIVVDVEKGQDCEVALATAEALAGELDGQNNNLKDTIKLKDEEIKTDEGMIASQKQLMADQEKVCEEKVKNAKPSIFDGLIKVLGGIGIGIILGILL